MFSSLSTFELLRLCTSMSSYGPEHLVSIFTDYADAAIVVFEVNYDKEKIVPYSYWRISEQDHDLVQATLTMLDEIPENNVIYPLINSDTLDSKGNPISSFLSLFHAECIQPYRIDSFTPLTGLMWFKQREKYGHLDMSQLSVNEKLRAELSRILTHKKEQPSVLVMAFLQGLIYSGRLTSGW